MTASVLADRLQSLLQDRPDAAPRWVRRSGARALLEPLALILLAGGAYGAAMGAWRSPTLALYVALKVPALFLLCALGNALGNGLWARRLGLSISIAECLRAQLVSFALAALLLGSLAPVLGFFALALPGPEDLRARLAHDLLGLAHVGAIALAGTLAVARQPGWLAALDPHARTSRLVVAAWLALNLLLGAQLSWNLRPWFGTPGLPVSFLREHPFDGTFYESVFRMLIHR